MKHLLQRRVVIPVIAVVVFISTTAFKNDFFEIAKQIEIFTTLYKEVNMNYVDDHQSCRAYGYRYKKHAR